jgi:hypothetical protein
MVSCVTQRFPGLGRACLEEDLGVPIDILTLGDLPSKFRDQVLAEAVPIISTICLS